MEYVFSPEILSFAAKGDLCYYCPFCNARLRNGTSLLYCAHKADHCFNIHGSVEAINYDYISFYFLRESIYYYGAIHPTYRKVNIHARNSYKEMIFNVDMKDFIPESIESLIEIMETYVLFS